jgi:CheY-like chemotaxis protein
MQPRPARQPRILVADNEPEILSLLQSIFEDEGYQYFAATSVEEACALLEKRLFDLVLADSFASKPSEVLKPTGSLRQAAGATPVILLTGHPVKPEEARAVGFRDVIVKPFDLESLLGHVQAVLAQSGQ